MSKNISSKTEESPNSINMDVVASPQQKTSKKNTNQETVASPRFLIVKRDEGDFANVSPFVIHKILYGLIGDLKQVRKIKDGLLIETVSAAQSRRLLAANKLGDFSVTVLPHRNLNTSKGVVYCPDLLNCSIEDILDGLKDQGVLEVRRMKVKRNGILVDSPNHVLTFNTPTLPKRIIAAFYVLQVRMYIPAPMRCFRCQKFGHTSSRCNGQQVCVCGKPLHEGQPCDEPVVCVNCSGLHSARSRDCPIYKQEAAIQELKTKENLSYSEAKRKVIVPTPTPNVSYAKAATSSAKVDYTDLVNELIPRLISALSSAMLLKPTSSTSMQLMSDYPDRRKRSLPSEQQSLSSGDESPLSSQVSDLGKRKRKPGWPKGKSRKQTSD